ncbi:grasp-with-spasm system SPASM domain peptide maturase [Ohtaekwangia kribbensis]|uniref:Grasp-with-spasm system SPASM domain peptide maturase n=1 Tax=Ohtaekwangia kribbensis TaxID=688913 RepID=A0ABW3K0Y8_9BACT
MKFKLYANCIPTKGAQRSTICDVQRGDIYLIPNALFDILSQHPNKSVDEVKGYYDESNAQVIDEYFSFLIDNELGFFCNNPENFPDIELAWESPEVITNAIVDIDSTSTYTIDKVLQELQDLGCKNIEFRIYNGYDLERLTGLLNKLEDSIFRYVSLLVRSHYSFSVENIKNLCTQFRRLQSVVVFGAEKDQTEDDIFYTTQNIESSNCCGVVSYKYFTPNLKMFSESRNFNSCLNRKVSIDVKGVIRNCPSMKEGYGDINYTELREVIRKPEFQKYWHITKDEIDICKVCEFRNVCTDCRAFTKEPPSLYSKPSKCSYDPYTTTWN